MTEQPQTNTKNVALSAAVLLAGAFMFVVADGPLVQTPPLRGQEMFKPQPLEQNLPSGPDAAQTPPSSGDETPGTFAVGGPAATADRADSPADLAAAEAAYRGRLEKNIASLNAAAAAADSEGKFDRADLMHRRIEALEELLLNAE